MRVCIACVRVCLCVHLFARAFARSCSLSFVGVCVRVCVVRGRFVGVGVGLCVAVTEHNRNVCCLMRARQGIHAPPAAPAQSAQTQDTQPLLGNVSLS